MILILNAGSSSLKFKLFDRELSQLAKGRVEEIGDLETSSYKFKFEHEKKGEHGVADHRAALELVLNFLKEEGTKDIEAVGHRVVHGGSKFTGAVKIDDNVQQGIEECIPLAPLHNPANLMGIKAARELFPGTPQVALFDTAFHTTIPEVAHAYAIPREYRQKGYRRYGFHGISHEYISHQLARMLGQEYEKTSLVCCHLGNGASLCAIRDGVSIDTSMGYTPLEGLVMGTRSGDIDAGLVLDLIDNAGLNSQEVNKLLNKQSGLLGLSGLDNDMRTILENLDKKEAALALDVYCYRLAKYIASYLTLLPAGSPVVFTAGVGENSADVRQKVLERLASLGYQVDAARNGDSGDRLITADDSHPAYAIGTNEERMIARRAIELLF